MQRTVMGWLILAVVALAGAARAGEDEAKPQLRLELDLVDGSRIIGTPAIASVRLQTTYAKMDIPLAQIAALTMGEEHETASVGLRNGDKVKGVIDLKPIELETVFGKVAVASVHIRGIRVMPSGGPLPEALRKGLVLYYTFDDSEDRVPDCSNNAHDGTVQGAAWKADGRPRGALEFDGVDDVVVSREIDSSRLAERMTACAWFKREKEGADLYLVSGQVGGSDGFALYYASPGETGERGYKAIVKDGQPWTGCWTHSTEGYDEDRNRWVHLALVYDGESLVLYRNGCEIGRDGGCGGRIEFAAAKVAARIGQCLGEGHAAGGLIDEVMIFDRALPEAEVKQIYAAQK